MATGNHLPRQALRKRDLFKRLSIRRKKSLLTVEGTALWAVEKTTTLEKLESRLLTVWLQTA